METDLPKIGLPDRVSLRHLHLPSDALPPSWNSIVFLIHWPTPTHPSEIWLTRPFLWEAFSHCPSSAGVSLALIYVLRVLTESLQQFYEDYVFCLSYQTDVSPAKGWAHAHFLSACLTHIVPGMYE